MIRVDFRKMRRPERSGWLAVVLVYAAVTTFYDWQWMKADLSEGELTVARLVGLVECYLFPWNCPVPRAQERQPPPPPRYHVTPLVLHGYGGKKKKQKECTLVWRSPAEIQEGSWYRWSEPVKCEQSALAAWQDIGEDGGVFESLRGNASMHIPSICRYKMFPRGDDNDGSGCCGIIVDFPGTTK